MESAPITMQRSKGIAYEDWKTSIQMATDVDQLVRVVRDYLAAWKPEELGQLPWDLAATALVEAEDIVSRAVLASRLELRFQGTEHERGLLREMALTLAAAATRVRLLKA